MNYDNCRILVVEDDIIFRDALVFALRRKKFQVEEATNAEDAFTLFESSFFDIVISDIVMPGNGGLSLLQKVKALRPETPVIMLMTGYSEITIEQACSEKANAIFCKPLDRVALFRVIENLLGFEKNVPSAEVANSGVKIKLFFHEIANEFESSTFSFVKNGLSLSILPPFPQVHDIAKVSVMLESKAGGYIQAIDCNGVVKWIFFSDQVGSRAEIGIEFMSLSHENEKKLARFII